MTHLIKLIALCNFLFFASNQVTAQFAIGRTTRDFKDADRNNRNVNVIIHYPALTNGTDVPIADGLFPAISIGHGFVMMVSSYDHMADSFAVAGMIGIKVNTETSFAPSHGDFGKDLAFVLKALKAESLISTSIFYNRVAENKAVIGHSMGGGATFLAGGADSDIDALVGFAPAETSVSAIGAAGNIDVPVLIFTAEDDCVVPPSGSPKQIYEALSGPCKWLMDVKQASHCKFALNNALCNIGEANCQGKLTHLQQQKIMFRYMMPFLKANLLDQKSPWLKIMENVSNDTEVSLQTPGFCSALSVKSPYLQSNKLIRIQANSYQLETTLTGSLRVFDLLGRQIFQAEVLPGISTIVINPDFKGIRLFVLSNKSGEQSWKMD